MGGLFSSVKVEGFFDGACRKVLGGARVSATNSVCIAAPLRRRLASNVVVIVVVARLLGAGCE